MGGAGHCRRHAGGRGRRRNQGGDRAEDQRDSLIGVRRTRCRGVDARGSATLEIVVLFPAVLLATFGLVQGALYYHARDMALAAATDGLAVARSRSGGGGEGRGAAPRFLRRAGGDDGPPASAVTSGRTAPPATGTLTGPAP